MSRALRSWGWCWLACSSMLLVLGCGPKDGDDSAEELGDDTSGDGDPSGDGDGDPSGDGDGDPSGDGDGDPFGENCALGCDHLLACAPDQFAGLYADTNECQQTCATLYGECVPEAVAYFECFIGLSCADVMLATTEGPDMTACGPSFAAAQAACGL